MPRPANPNPNMPAEQKRLVEFIRSRMDIMGISTFDELGDRLGCSYANVSLIMSGAVKKGHHTPARIALADIEKWITALRLEGQERDWFHEMAALLHTDDWFRARFAEMKKTLRK
jgi:hypothetical protein